MLVVLPWGGNTDLAQAKSAHSNSRILARMESLSLISVRDFHDVCLPSRHLHSLKKEVVEVKIYNPLFTWRVQQSSGLNENGLINKYIWPCQDRLICIL